MSKFDQILLLASEAFLRDLRRRLLVIILIAVVPVLSLILYQAKIARDLRIAESQETAWEITENVGFRQARFIESAKQLLTILAHAPQVVSGDAAACSEFLRQVAESNHVYVDIGVADVQGWVRCRAHAGDAREDLSRSSHFQRALTMRDFAIGDYQFHAGYERKSVGFALPMIASDGVVRAVVFAALDVSWINQLAAESHLPSQVALSIVDSKGTLLARFPDPEKWVGKHIPDAPLFEMLRLRRQESRELTGLDGVERVYALKPLSLNPNAGQFYVMVGIPKSLAIGEVGRALARHLTWLFLVTLIAGTFAWLIGSKFVVGYVRLRVQAEEERGRLAAIVESSEDAIVGMTLSGIVTSWNDGAESIYGFSASEMIGRSVFQLIPSAQHREVAELLKLVKEGRGVNRYESRRIRNNGECFDVSASLSPVRDLQGNIIGAATITRDITFLRRGEERLLAYTKQLETLNQMSVELSETLSLEQVAERGLSRLLAAGGCDFAFVHFSRDVAGKNFYGRSAEPRSQSELDALGAILARDSYRGGRDGGDPWFIEDVASAAQIAAAHEHQIKSLAILPLTLDSEWRASVTLVNSAVRTLDTDQRELLHAMSRQIVLALDNSRLYNAVVQANEGLQKEIEERKRAEQTLADFTAMIAHDLRSPLSNVMSIVGSIAEGLFGPVTEMQQKWLLKVSKNCRSLIGHISDFLDLSKIDAGKLQLNKAQVDLGTLLRHAFVEHSLEAEHRRIRFTSEIEGELPLMTLDRGRIAHVLENLLSNAFKFTDDGGAIEIAARRRAGDGTVVLWVKDSGIGISRDEFDDIFDKYRRASNVEHSDRGGTGLGLAICKKVVEAHGGRIWVESELQKGSVFFVSLPLDVNDAEERFRATG